MITYHVAIDNVLHGFDILQGGYGNGGKEQVICVMDPSGLAIIPFERDLLRRANNGAYIHGEDVHQTCML